MASDPSLDPAGPTPDLVAMADDLEVRLGELRAAIARLSGPDSTGPPT